MEFYMMVSLGVIFGLLAWWLFLAISGYRDEFSISRAENAPMSWRGRLANSLITIFSFWRSHNRSRKVSPP